jgi:dihydrofolate reductase
VITRDKNFNSDNQFDLTVVGSIDEAFVKLHTEKEVFIIGGGEIYKQSIDSVDTIYITLVHTIIDGDVYFPEIDKSNFDLVWEEKHLADEKNKFDFTFQKFERK